MNYRKYADKAMAKISRYGSPVTVCRSAARTYNPDTNAYEGDGTTISGWALQESLEQRDIDGTNIRAGDIVLMAALDGAPRTNDTVIFGGRSYTAVSVGALSPDGETGIYYTIQAR